MKYKSTLGKLPMGPLDDSVTNLDRQNSGSLSRRADMHRRQPENQQFLQTYPKIIAVTMVNARTI